MTLEMNMNTGSHASVLQSTIPYSRASSTAHRRIACRDCSLYGVLPVSRRICETIAPPRGGHRGGRAETTHTTQRYRHDSVVIVSPLWF